MMLGDKIQYGKITAHPDAGGRALDHGRTLNGSGGDCRPDRSRKAGNPQGRTSSEPKDAEVRLLVGNNRSAGNTLPRLVNRPTRSLRAADPAAGDHLTDAGREWQIAPALIEYLY